MNTYIPLIDQRTTSMLTDDKGQTLVEYALLLLLLVIIVALAVPGVSTALVPKYASIAAALLP